MKTVTLIFPHQLFLKHTAVNDGIPVYLVEEFLFFKQYNFHKHKLLLHRASMKFYEQHLLSNNINVHYINSADKDSDIRFLLQSLSEKGVTKIQIADVADEWLYKRLENGCDKYQIELEVFDSPAFLTPVVEFDEYIKNKTKYFHADFYAWQRKRLNLLLQADGSPVGGRWSFDKQNQKKIPKNETVPQVKFLATDQYILEAKIYIEKYFPDNYGNIEGPYLFVSNHENALAWLRDFLHNRFSKFGIYEDAIVEEEHILFHSVLTPMLNVGLITPAAVIKITLEYATKNEIPLNSLEGFIRQVIGWREFVRLVYVKEGTKQRTTNYWKFTRKIPKPFWEGTTGIEPVDTTIKKILKTGYCHHIERLMVLGNFMLLCEFDPDDVYKWFMKMFIDAYDWVMVPNIYGMTQFADGGLMTTKPYISGSNYIMKMSNYKKGKWQEIWDGLFWRFMSVHRNFFAQNPRLGMLLGTLDKMDSTKRNTHFDQAENFLKSLDKTG